MENAIEFDNVTFSYDGAQDALKGLSFTVPNGQFLCILGGNGSGKSTLAKHVNALLLPDSGNVRVLGKSTDDPQNLFFIRSHAGMVFQNPDDQIVASIVEDDVAFGPENLGIPADELQRIVPRCLERVGLSGFERRETTALSGGQKQRVALAGVLAMEPRILILDEAGAMLDPRGRRSLLELCESLHGEGFTILLITHFMEEAAHGDRVIVMREGSIAMDGTPDEVLTQPWELTTLNLDIPFPVQMCKTLQERGVPVTTTTREAMLTEQLKGLLQRSSLGTEDVAPGQGVVDTPVIASSDLAGSDNGPIVSFRDVSFSYEGKSALKRSRKRDGEGGAHPDSLWALRNVSFSLNAGDFMGIAGHTGSGKSTLLQLSNGLLQPTEGSVTIEGHDLSHRRQLAEVRRDVGLVFQYPERQLFAPTVFEDVAFGPRNLGLDSDEIARRVNEALESVHLDPAAFNEKSPFALSGGQQRRVALAGVLAMEPKVLFLDEPTVGLDPLGRHRLLALIQDLHDSKGISIAMVSHSMDDLARLCNRIMVLSRGRIAEQGTPKEVFSKERELKSLGLGIPATERLARALGLADLWDGIPTIEQLASAISSEYVAMEAD